MAAASSSACARPLRLLRPPWAPRRPTRPAVRASHCATAPNRRRSAAAARERGATSEAQMAQTGATWGL
eukprot:5055938-Pleurochrysis_carterae.AAC.1